jgi:3,4-dihydroxy 2-butanone 4-phosphate synthase / GTP cyclohydrolase II
MFTPIPEILAELRAGRMVILTDDERRENEGDLVLPAKFASPEAITFMLKEAKGYLCLSLTEADCDRLDLVPQSTTNTSVRGTAFTVSIDLHPKFGGTTGVSAKERARCIQLAIDPATTPADFVRPGHINPLRSRDGGVLVRTGQTEGSIDLCRLAGLSPAACIIEVMRDDGEMARVPDLLEFASCHGLKMCSVAQIIKHRLQQESLVKRLEPIAGTPMKTTGGEWRIYAYESLVDPLPHVVLTLGLDGEIGHGANGGTPIAHDQPTLVRVHRANLLGDVFMDLDSGKSAATGESLQLAMQAIQREGRGAVVYLRHESPGDGLAAMLMRVRQGPHDSGADAPALAHREGVAGNAMPLQERVVGIGSQILRDLGITKLKLLTSSARAIPVSQSWPALEGFGIEVVEHVPLRAN